PAKVYFTWEGEAGSLEEAGVEVVARERTAAAISELEIEVRVLERLLNDATRQMQRILELIDQQKRAGREE
ncbi:MAG: hypothetical protein ACLGHL_09480, partial [Actinomycetota bacterium]